MIKFRFWVFHWVHDGPVCLRWTDQGIIDYIVHRYFSKKILFSGSWIQLIPLENCYRPWKSSTNIADKWSEWIWTDRGKIIYKAKLKMSKSKSRFKLRILYLNWRSREVNVSVQWNILIICNQILSSRRILWAIVCDFVWWQFWSFRVR